jgi:uncharacterized protein
VVLQATTFCNIACRYCYLPERDMHRRLDADQVATAFKNITDHFTLNSDVQVAWHSGEPLTMAPDYYQKSMDVIRRIVSDDIRLTFEFQTNATLLTNKWAPLYMRPDVRFGISVDGPKFIHDRNRKCRSGRGTFDRVKAAIDRLNAAEVQFSVICVLDEQFLDSPEIYEAFFEENAIYEVSFNIPNREGVNTFGFSNSIATHQRLREFYRYFVRKSMAGTNRIRIFQVEDMLRKVASPTEIYVQYHEHYPFRILTVNANGKFATFSPELAGFAHAKHGSFDIGTVFPEFSIDRRRVVLFRDDIAKGVARCKAECDYFEVCGGGIPSTKYFDTETFDVAGHFTCQLAVKLLADVVADEVLALHVRKG